MPRRYFNWKLAAVLVIGILVLSMTAYGLRQWHRERRALSGLQAGNTAYDERKWEEAAKHLGRYLAIEQSDVPILLKYADAQLNIRPLKMNNIQQAIAAYRAVLRIDKTELEAAQKLAEIYLQMQMPGEAELIITRIPETKQSLDLRRILAVTLAAQRKFKESANVLNAVINENPEHVLAYEILGQLIEQRREHFTEEPVFWFNEAVKNNPSSALAYLIRAAYYLRAEDKAKALADLQQAEKLDPSDTATRLRLAQELISANQLDKAEKHLNEAQKSDSANLMLWHTFARLALKSQSKEKMLQVAETGLTELSSQPWNFMPIAAELYIKCDKLKLAGDCISRLKENDIAIPTVAFLEGLLADKQGHRYEAIKCWQQAIELGNKSPVIRLAIALTLSNLGDKQSAVRQLHTLISEQPHLFDARMALAKLLAETGNWDKAEEHARIARQISPGDTEAALLYIQIQSQLLKTNKNIQNDATWQRIDDELASLDEAAKSEPSVRLLQAKLAVRRSQFDKAEDLLSDIRQNHPGQIEVEMTEVELLTAQGKNDETILKLEHIVEAYPQSLKAVEYLAALLEAAEQHHKCENLIKEAMTRLDRPLDQCELGLLLADFYNKWGQKEKSCQLLTHLNQNLPPNIRIKRRLLRCEEVTGNIDFARKLIDDIKTLEGENGWQWQYEQAKIWSMSDNFNEFCPKIISLLKENLLTNPDDQNSRVLLAATYERTGDLQLAASTYQEALNRSPGDTRIIIPAVALLYKINEYERADEILRQVDSDKLSHPELKRLELQSHLRRGDLSSATDILEDFAADDPNDLSVRLSLALLNIRQNRFAEANDLLTQLKIQEPNSLPVTVAQIELSLRQDKSDDAISLCDETVKRLNNASAYVLRGKTFASLGQTDKAQNDFENATAVEPNNARAWMAKSDFYRSIDQLDKAVTSIQKAASLTPANLEVKKRAITLLLARGERDSTRRAKNMLNEALVSNPEDVELQLYKARLLIAENTAPGIEQAEDIILKITEKQPDLADAWVLLAKIALSQEQSARAMDIALRGLVHKPYNKSLLLVKARAEAARSPALSVPTLKALQELYQNDADVLVQLANTYLDSGESQKAVYLLEKKSDAFENTADKRKVSTAFAKALYKNGNKTQANKEFNSLYLSEPDDPGPLLAQVRLFKDEQLWDQLSMIVMQWCQNHPKDVKIPIIIARQLAAVDDNQAKKTAEDILQRTLQNDSDNTDTMNMLAMLLQITGRLEEAAQLYQQLLTIQPDRVVAINNLAWILCEEKGQYEQALELAQRGLNIAPDYVDLIDTRGVAYYWLGDLDNAVKDFTRCVKLYPEGNPSAVVSYLHLGMALEKLGQEDEAVENLKKALELNAKTGGLSATDFAEAQRLLKELAQKGV